MADVHAVTSVTGGALRDAASDILAIAYDDLLRARAKRLDDLGLEPEGQIATDLVLLLVPGGRGHKVANALVNGGFAHGDVRVEDGKESQ